MISQDKSLSNKAGVFSFVLMLLWAGILIGVSFMATPIKFQAPTLTLGPALDVGRHTFALLNKVEWGLFILTVISGLWAHNHSRNLTVFFALLISILAFQTFYLLPVLNERVQLIIDGSTPAPSYSHTIYAVLELVKLVLLLSKSLRAITRNSRESLY